MTGLYIYVYVNVEFDTKVTVREMTQQLFYFSFSPQSPVIAFLYHVRTHTLEIFR